MTTPIKKSLTALLVNGLDPDIAEALDNDLNAGIVKDPMMRAAIAQILRNMMKLRENAAS